MNYFFTVIPNLPVYKPILLLFLWLGELFTLENTLYPTFLIFLPLELVELIRLLLYLLYLLLEYTIL